MSEEPPNNKKKGLRKARPKRPSRKLSFASRVRGTLRRGIDKVLGLDLAWSATFIIVVLLILGSQRCGGDYGQYAVGETATEDIEASYEFEVIDEKLTAERRGEAASNQPKVYVHDGNKRVRMAEKLSAIFSEGRRLLDETSLMDADEAAAEIERGLQGRVGAGPLAVLLALQFEESLERKLLAALDVAMEQPVIGSKISLEEGETIEILHLPGQRRESVEDYEGIIDLDEARRRFGEKVSATLALPPRHLAELIGFADDFVDTSLHSDEETTARRKREAAQDVPPVLTRVAQGTLIVKQGDKFTEETIAKLEAMRESSWGSLGLREFLGLLFIICMLAFFLYRYCGYHQRGFRKLQHLHALIVLMLLLMLLLAKAILWIAGEVGDSLPHPYNQLDPYTYLIPLGAGAILLTLLANARIAMVYSSYVSLLFGAMQGWNFYVMLWAMIVQLCGVYAISTYRERAALLRAGLVVGGGGAVTALAVETLSGELDPLSSSLFGAGLAFVGGAVGVGLLISFSLPLLEGLFNVLTDIRLLELSNVNNPLLSQLAVKAPGSYNHSLVVGSLAEEGANAIGANGLLCRVGAFYHDVGKINHAEYFVENQRGFNPHDRLTPSMSALIIASHVKDGIKMAREAGLPEQIIDIIPQHHGTRLMTFFYEKAKSSADPSLDPVKEVDFRYPGPKPQTKEAAIFMLADAVEAAARTVEEPTRNRLREMIRKVTNSVVLDGQLDSCDLTFSDLERIQEAFLRFLVSTYHHRVDYPGFDFKSPKPDKGQGGDNANRKSQRSS
jgi:putative nucleotidyltransferase with HDIG domain